MRRARTPSPAAFAACIKSLRPGCNPPPEALQDWQRRVALSLLPSIGLRVGSRRAVAYLLAAGL